MNRNAYYEALDRITEIFGDCVKYGVDYDGIEELADIKGVTPKILSDLGERIEDIAYWINEVARKLESDSEEEK